MAVDGVWVQQGRRRAPRPHPTKRLTIKSADVDEMMVPLVKWLNAIEGVITLYCCQGEPRRKNQSLDDYCDRHPYLCFLCRYPADLVRILSMLGGAATVQVDWMTECGGLWYRVEFHDQQRLQWVLERLAQEKARKVKR